jgi:hypothetical protein
MVVKKERRETKLREKKLIDESGERRNGKDGRGRECCEIVRRKYIY